MKVNLIKSKTVLDFAQKHSSSIRSFEEWVYKVTCANWNKPGDIKLTFASADLLGKGSNRAIFNVGGNNYRVICSYYFNEEIQTATFFVKWVGTHAEYDKLCAEGKQYTIDLF